MLRRCHNQIVKLKSPVMGWLSGREAMGRKILEFYQHLFSTNSPTIPQDLDNLNEPLITSEDNEILIKLLDAEEILSTLKKMAPEKASGPDGMTMFFFRFFWDVVGVDMMSTVLDFFTNGDLLPALNHTNITLIPKVDNPSKVTQFRPISLYNVIYKIISKLMTERLKLVLPKFISPFSACLCFGSNPSR